jgi:FMN phosphatase YigB (HAD superfamily)
MNEYTRAAKWTYHPPKWWSRYRGGMYEFGLDGETIRNMTADEFYGEFAQNIIDDRPDACAALAWAKNQFKDLGYFKFKNNSIKIVGELGLGLWIYFADKKDALMFKMRFC